MNTTTATSRQMFALFCATGKDWRNRNLTMEQASSLISALMPLKGNKPAALERAEAILAGAPVEALPTVEAKPSFAAIYKEADKAGREAANACRPIPMIIEGYAPVMGGVCGFAWVRFPDARKPFAKWIVKEGKGSRNTYSGGVEIWAGFDIGNQSLAIKEAYCAAFAEVCNKHDIDARMGSRID